MCDFPASRPLEFALAGLFRALRCQELPLGPGGEGATIGLFDRLLGSFGRLFDRASPPDPRTHSKLELAALVLSPVPILAHHRSEPRVKPAWALTERAREFERFSREGDANAWGSRRTTVGPTQTESAAASATPRSTPESPTFPSRRLDGRNQPSRKEKPARVRGPVRSSHRHARLFAQRSPSVARFADRLYISLAAFPRARLVPCACRGQQSPPNGG